MEVSLYGVSCIQFSKNGQPFGLYLSNSERGTQQFGDFTAGICHRFLNIAYTKKKNSMNNNNHQVDDFHPIAQQIFHAFPIILARCFSSIPNIKCSILHFAIFSHFPCNLGDHYNFH